MAPLWFDGPRIEPDTQNGWPMHIPTRGAAVCPTSHHHNADPAHRKRGSLACGESDRGTHLVGRGVQPSALRAISLTARGIPVSRMIHSLRREDRPL